MHSYCVVYTVQRTPRYSFSQRPDTSEYYCFFKSDLDGSDLMNRARRVVCAHSFYTKEHYNGCRRHDAEGADYCAIRLQNVIRLPKESDIDEATDENVAKLTEHNKQKYLEGIKVDETTNLFDADVATN